MASYTTGAIALQLIRNAQGGYYFMSLTTGCHHNLPMPQDIIDHVHAIACHQGATAGLTFANCYGIPHDPYDLDSDDKDNSSYSPSDTDSDDASNHSDDDADPNLATATDNITGVAEYDEEVEELVINDNVNTTEVDNNVDKHIKTAGVDGNANDNAEIAGVGDNHYPQDDNYYPQAFHDETGADDDEVIDTEQPDGDDDPVVEMVEEEEEDLCNDLEHAMDKQYGT